MRVNRHSNMFAAVAQCLANFDLLDSSFEVIAMNTIDRGHAAAKETADDVMAHDPTGAIRDALKTLKAWAGDTVMYEIVGGGLIQGGYVWAWYDAQGNTDRVYAISPMVE